MRAKRILCVSARSFAVFSRFSRKADGPVRCIVAGLAGGAAVSLCGCAQLPPQRLGYANSTEYFPSSIYGPASPCVVADGEPVPRGGGMYMLGRPYTIAGLTYYPSEKHYAAIGLASWYGDAFHGRRTANGEVYDRDSISAAHPTLPLPSYARVTNLRNHYSMIVRINDRGPFAAHRIMDVSRRTAEALDFRQSGTTPVKIEYIGA
ncbi:MAG: septal ring lytic transglycosylase RlpA family protein, partial [Methylocella sp.]